jgi:RNA polymerase sigma factor (sigma-70 family)
VTKSTDLMTDEAIMEAVKNGDLQQMSLLFERYHKRIFNFLARMTMDRDLAEDLTQNVFLRMIRYRASFKGLKFQSWAYQVARNIFSDHYQAHKNKNTNFVDIEKVSDHTPDTNDTIMQDEREALLHRSLAMLDEEQREVLVLTRFQQLKYEEVAVIMETTVANVKVKVHRAIAKLREHYFALEKIS